MSCLKVRRTSGKDFFVTYLSIAFFIKILF